MNWRSRILTRRCAIFIAMAFAPIRVASPQEHEGGPSANHSQSAAYWIGQLNSDQFDQRERAIRQLAQLGQPAIEPLLAELTKDQPEVQWRGVAVLGWMTDCDDDATAFAAEEALVRLAQSPEKSLARQASEALGQSRGKRQPRAMRRIKELGGELRVSQGQGEQQVTVSIGSQWTGKLEALRFLGSIKTLRGLDLEGSGATDDWIAPLVRCQSLVWIGLNDTRITDGGLEHLSSLRSLRRVYLSGTRVTDEGVRRLQKQLPRATILR